jgi:hypothetical protein
MKTFIALGMALATVGAMGFFLGSRNARAVDGPLAGDPGAGGSASRPSAAVDPTPLPLPLTLAAPSAVSPPPGTPRAMPVAQPIAVSRPVPDDGGAGRPDDGGPSDVLSARLTHAQLSELASQLRAQHDEDVQRTAEMVAALHDLREQLSDARAQLAARQEERERRVAALSSAATQLQQADQALANGSSDVDDQLRRAEESLSGLAQSYMAMARQALSSEDLYGARIYTQLAAAAVSANQVAGVNEPITQP